MIRCLKLYRLMGGTLRDSSTCLLILLRLLFLFHHHRHHHHFFLLCPFFSHYTSSFFFSLISFFPFLLRSSSRPPLLLPTSPSSNFLQQQQHPSRLFYSEPDESSMALQHRCQHLRPLQAWSPRDCFRQRQGRREWTARQDGLFRSPLGPERARLTEIALYAAPENMVLVFGGAVDVGRSQCAGPYVQVVKLDLVKPVPGSPGK